MQVAWPFVGHTQAYWLAKVQQATVLFHVQLVPCIARECLFIFIIFIIFIIIIIIIIIIVWSKIRISWTNMTAEF